MTCAHNLYDRQSKQEPTDVKFTPAINGQKGRPPIKVKEFHYPREFRTLEGGKASEYDFGVLELEEELKETNGYLGIDTR